MKSQFPHPVFKSSGDVEVMRNVDPTALQRMRPVLEKDYGALVVAQPKMGWKEFQADQEAIDRKMEEAVPYMDRPVCLDFLRGHCPNPQCLNRHEDDGSVIAPPVRTSLPKEPKRVQKIVEPQKRAMNRMGVTSKHLNRSNAQENAKPHGLPIPKHPADILREKGPGAQESSDSGEGSLPPEAGELEDPEADSPLSHAPVEPVFPEKRAPLPLEKMKSRPAPEQPLDTEPQDEAE